MLNSKFFRGLTLALGVSWNLCCFGVINASPTRPEELNQRFPQVVEIRSRVESCTGTLVGPRVIISAAHCADLKSPYLIHKGRRYAVTYASSGAYARQQHDVAVALTREDILGAQFSSVGRGGVRHGSIITLAGFGCTERGGRSGTLHVGVTKVIGMDENHLLSFSNVGGVLCQGDSGGPAFLRQGNHDVLVGVNSEGDIKNINLDVRLDSALSRGFLKRVAERFHVAICGITRTCPATADFFAQN